MTNNQTTDTEREDVTQEDRALAAQLCAIFLYSSHWVRETRDGLQDDQRTVQLVARHRRLAQAEGRREGLEEAANVAEEWNGETRTGDTLHIAMAIRTLIEGSK